MQVEQLMEQLLQQERYGLAAYVGSRWQLPVQHAWEQWARSLILYGISLHAPAWCLLSNYHCS